MSIANRRSSLRSVFPLLIASPVCAVAFYWGLRTGSALVPLRSSSAEVARAVHPSWFWFVELIWGAFSVLAGLVGIFELRKPRPESATKATPQLKPKPPAPATPPVSRTSSQPPGSRLRSTSPSCRYIIRVYPEEMRMSHWVDRPELVDTISGRTLFAPQDPNWSMDSAIWQSESVVAMTLRRYPGDHTPIKATFDCVAGIVDVGGVAIGNVSNGAKVESALMLAYELSRSTYRPKHR